MGYKMNYAKRLSKVKSELDVVFNALLEDKKAVEMAQKEKKMSLTSLDFEELDLATLIEIQSRISRVMLEKSKDRANS